MVSEAEMVSERWATRRTDVQVVRRESGGADECLAVRDPQMAFIDVADASKTQDRLSDIDRADVTSMSINGFACNPGTAVLPTCSMSSARSPTALPTGDLISSKNCRAGSYATTMMLSGTPQAYDPDFKLKA